MLASDTWFAGGVGGHASVTDVARTAASLGVGRLVFAHIGRPTTRAIDAGLRPAFGEFGRDGRRYLVRARCACLGIGQCCMPEWSPA